MADHLFEAVLTIFLLLVLFEILAHRIELIRRDDVLSDFELSLAFYRDDYVLTTDPDGQVKRSDFLRGPDGKIAWLRDGGRLIAKQG